MKDKRDLVEELRLLYEKHDFWEVHERLHSEPSFFEKVVSRVRGWFK